MSYAEAAAQGPEQSREEARAPIPPKVRSSASSSLKDVDSPHVSTVPPNYENQDVKTGTQAERLDREAEAAEEAEAEEEEGAGKERGGGKGKERARDRAKAAAGRGREKATGSCAALARNKANPVVLVNTLLIATAGAGLGYNAYQRHLHGSLTWETVAMWSGSLGAAGVIDYFASRWFLQNRYPPK